MTNTIDHNLVPEMQPWDILRKAESIIKHQMTGPEKTALNSRERMLLLANRLEAEHHETERLIAERDEARAAVDRVRELAEHWDPEEPEHCEGSRVLSECGIELRRALDGEA